MPEKRKLLGEYLVEKGVISPAQLKEVVTEHFRTNRKIGDILVQRGYAREEDISKAVSEQLGFPYLDVVSYRFDTACVALVSAETARKFQVIPVYKIGNTLTVAMANPLDVDVIDKMEKITRCDIQPVVATSSGIQGAINKYYGSSAQPAGSLVSYEVKTADVENKGVGEDLSKLMKEAAQAPVVKLVNQLLIDAVSLRASDIHLEPQEKSFYCRYRVDGILQNFLPLPPEYQSAIVSRIKIMADMDISEKRLPQDGRIQLNIDGKQVDLRVASFPTIYGEHVAVRILDKSTGILKLEELGLVGEYLEKFSSMIRRPHGMILVTGPTGSGKTTTLYSVLNTLKDSKKNIITLEDPVEYSIDRIHQSQVNVKAGLTFANGLRSIVRLDPDIIMIGEIRDKETAEIAIHAALTGHLVFSTLHTNDAPSAYSRLIDIGVEPYLAASSVTAILAQRLLRKLCPKCKKSYQPTDEEIAVFHDVDKSKFQKAPFYKDVGCKECKSTGYLGRTGIFELLVPDDTIRQLVAKKTPSHEISSQARRLGMTTLREDGLDKVKKGMTTVAEILRTTENIS